MAATEATVAGTPCQPPDISLRAYDNGTVKINTPITTNSRGGKQAKLQYLFTDFDARDVLRVARVSAAGHEAYGPKNYMKLSTEEHINHALAHINEFLTGDQTEDFLAKAICRLYFAMATDRVERLNTNLAEPFDEFMAERGKVR
jgi:hypothetical protein